MVAPGIGTHRPSWPIVAGRSTGFGGRIKGISVQLGIGSNKRRVSGEWTGTFVRGRERVENSAEDDLVEDDADVDRNEGDCPGRGR